MSFPSANRPLAHRSAFIVIGLMLFAFVGAPLAGMAGQTHHVLEHENLHSELRGHAALHDHAGAGYAPMIGLEDRGALELFHTFMHEAQGNSNALLPFEIVNTNMSARQDSSTFEPYAPAGLPLPPPGIPFRPPLAS